MRMRIARGGDAGRPRVRAGRRARILADAPPNMVTAFI